MEWNKGRVEMLKNLPSPSSHIDEKKPFTMDKLLSKNSMLNVPQSDEKGILKKKNVAK